MDLVEYSRFDALGLADLVARGEVTPHELALTARAAIAAVDPQINAVVETYADRIEEIDESQLGGGPFRGVPFLIKDASGHEAGRRIEFGSRLCRGLVAPRDTHVAELLRASGVNIIGRSNTPEYSMAGTTENALYGNTSNPWRSGYSPGGSTGGGAAAVVAGIVPIAHGSDIAGSIRIPASWCGGVGLKPSRGRISSGPMLDELGWGLAVNFVQTRSVRDTAAMLDCLAVPQPGDPFVIPRPSKPYAELATRALHPLRIALTTTPLMGLPVDAYVVDAVRETAALLASMGHHVEEVSPPFDGLAVLRQMMDVWFFGFDARIAMYAERTGQAPGPDTLEPAVLQIWEHACSMTPAQFQAAVAGMNEARRTLGSFLSPYDVWITPTTTQPAEPWGNYGLGRADVPYDAIAETLYRPIAQFTLPHNIMGTPAISLPLAMHPDGLPIGVQLGAKPAHEHVVLQLASQLEVAQPWAQRVPPLHVSRP